MLLSKFVSARPIALASNLLIDDKVDESSILVGDIPLQFWKMIRMVLSGRGVSGRTFIVMRVPVSVVSCDVVRWGRLTLDGNELWFILGNRRSYAQRRCQFHHQVVSRLCRFDCSQGCSCLAWCVLLVVRRGCDSCYVQFQGMLTFGLCFSPLEFDWWNVGAWVLMNLHSCV